MVLSHYLVGRKNKREICFIILSIRKGGNFKNGITHMQLKILKNDTQNFIQHLSRFQVDISVQLQQDKERKPG